MPSASSQKLVRKLQQRKHRWQERKFIAEGPKVVKDLLAAGLEPHFIWASDQFEGAELVAERDLQALSNFSTFNKVLAVFDFPDIPRSGRSERVLVLDRINDPGNLGTLIRSADWFGFEKIYCSKGTADVYNPKTVQSTMGSLARVEIDYREEDEIWDLLDSDYAFLVADMDGENAEDLSISKEKIALVMGSESHGPSDFWKEKAQAITIRRSANRSIDSLNVSVAGGILMQLLRLPSL